MKHKLWGIMGILLTLTLTALSLTGCDSAPTEPSLPDPLLPTVTLTGIMASYNGVAVSQNTQLNNLKTNLNVIAQYSDNTYKTLRSSDYSLTGTLTAGTSAITVYYEGKTATFTVTVIVPQLSGAISISPNTGVTINTLLTAVYSGNEPGVTCQWKKDGVNVGANAYYYTPTTVGNYTVTVSAAGYQSKTSAAVEVNDPSLSTLNGDIINSFDSVVEPGTWLSVYYNGSETVSFQWYKDGTAIPGATSSTYMPTEAGSYTVMVSAAGYNPITSPAVEVSYRTLTGITLNTDWVKKDYRQNDYLDLGNLEVIASYSDGSTTSLYYYYCTSSPANYETLSTTGTITVTISYTEGNVTKTASFTVTVSAVTPAKTLTGITLNTASVKKHYSQNELLDLSGLAVTAAYSDGSNAAVTGYTSSPAHGAALSTTGTRTVTISYTGGNVTKTASFTVTVNAATSAKTLTSITLNTHSVKKYYIQNEQLDLSGMVVTAVYSDKSRAAVTTYTSSPANGATLSTAGTITVTVSYTDGAVTKTATSYVNVADFTTGTPWLVYEFITSGSNANTYRVRCDNIKLDWNDDTLRGAVIIPATYNGLPVTEIGGPYDELGNNALGNTTAFGNKTGLTSIEIPASVTSIGKLAFVNCTSLTSITFAAGSQLQTIDSYAFSSTKWYNNQPDGLVYAAKVLLGYKGTMPANTVINNIRTDTIIIADDAFYDCPNLTSITVDANNPNYASQDGILYNKAKTSFVLIQRAISGSVTIPSGVTYIVGSAFNYCTRLTSITIPASVTTIGSWAFRFCTSLTSITIPAGVMTVGESAFPGWTNAQTIYVPWRSGNRPSGWHSNWNSGCNARIVYQE
jgi:hypothetical protein